MALHKQLNGSTEVAVIRKPKQAELRKSRGSAHLQGERPELEGEVAEMLWYHNLVKVLRTGQDNDGIVSCVLARLDSRFEAAFGRLHQQELRLSRRLADQR